MENTSIKKSKTFCNLMLVLHFPQSGCQVATQPPDKTATSREQQSTTNQLSDTSVLLVVITFTNSLPVLLSNARAALDSIGTEIAKDTKSRYLIVGHANRTGRDDVSRDLSLQRANIVSVSHLLHEAFLGMRAVVFLAKR
jgi:outer membrane protein OmpA-like peptidoglycan-associated protein